MSTGKTRSSLIKQRDNKFSICEYGYAMLMLKNNPHRVYLNKHIRILSYGTVLYVRKAERSELK
jgi:hypothetical protein